MNLHYNYAFSTENGLNSNKVEKGRIPTFEITLYLEAGYIKFMTHCIFRACSLYGKSMSLFTVELRATRNLVKKSVKSVVSTPRLCQEVDLMKLGGNKSAHPL